MKHKMYYQATLWEKFLLLFVEEKFDVVRHPLGAHYIGYKKLKNTIFYTSSGTMPPHHFNCRHNLYGNEPYLTVSNDIRGEL